MGYKVTMYNTENGAAILREAAYTEGYKAGKKDAVEQVLEDIDRIMNERLDYCLQLSGDKSLHSVGGMADAYGYLRNRLPKLKKKYGVK